MGVVDKGKGNKIADQLAKPSGSQCPLIGPTLDTGAAKEATRHWMDRHYRAQWQSTSGQKQAKQYLGKPSAKKLW